MKIKKKKSLHLQTQQGFNLVELLVSMFLALILIGAVAQSYLSSKATYRNTTQISELQNNARFASYFLGVDAKKAGNAGCFKDIESSVRLLPDNAGLFNFNVPFQVWNYTGTSLGDNFVMADDAPAPEADRGKWRNTNNSPLPIALANQVIAGSDVIVFMSISENLPITLTDTNIKEAEELFINSTHNIDQGQLMLIGDCKHADIFQHASESNVTFELSGTATPGNKIITDGWIVPWDSTDEVRKVYYHAYYIGQGVNGRPALVRMDLSRGTGVTPIQELVENTYSLQVIIAEDTDIVADGIPNHIVSADNVIDLSKVTSLKIGLLHGGSNSSYVDDIPADIQTYLLADSVTITPANKQLNYYALNKTVKLQNKGTTTSFAYETKESLD